MVSSRLPVQQVQPSDIAVIVPVGGAAPAWSRCAQSLARLDPAPGEVVAVIDGPNADQAKKAAEIGARVVVLEKQGGPARARNRGVQTASRDILLFIDADVEVPTHLIARVVEIFSANRNVSAVMGSYDDAPSDPGFVSQYRNLLHHFVHQNGREAASTFWAGCGAIRRQAFQEVGGFDESYSDPSVEDIELGSRLLRAGHKIHLVKDLQVKHMKTWRLADILATDLMRRAIPWTELMLRDGRIINDLNVKTRDRISVVTAYVMVFTLLAAWIRPALLAASALAMILMVVLNARLFRFYLRKRGILFAAGAIPLYGLYLLTSGLGFMLGLLRHLIKRRR